MPKSRDHSILFITILVILLFIGLLACFAGLYTNNITINTYEAELAYLNRRIGNEAAERRILQARLWELENRHEQRLIKLAKQYDIIMAAQRGGWRTVDKLIIAGAFDP